MLFILNSCYKKMRSRKVLFYVNCLIDSHHNISLKQQTKTRIKIEIEKNEEEKTTLRKSIIFKFKEKKNHEENY